MAIIPVDILRGRRIFCFGEMEDCRRKENIEIHECKSQYKKAEIIIFDGQTGDEKKDF